MSLVHSPAIDPSLIEQGLGLMLYGMGTVILFLSLLVLAVRLMSFAVRRWLPEPEQDPLLTPASPQALSEGAENATGDAARLMAVMAAAVHAHRAARSRQHLPR